MMQVSNFNQRPLDVSQVFTSGIKFDFILDVREDITSRYVELPEFRLSEAPWKIKMYKKSIGKEDKKKEFISIHLVSCLETEDRWSCEARAMFKLNNTDENNSLIQHLPKQKFDNNCKDYGIESFIEWNEFIRNFVYKDKAYFEIKIFANPLLRGGQINIEETGKVVHHMIKDVSNLGESYSDEFDLRGIKWRIVTKRNEENLEAYLCIPDESTLDINWSWKTNVTFKLIPFNREKSAPVEIKFTEVFRWGMNSWGTHLMKWADFIDPNKFYVARDSAILFAYLNVEPAEPLWNHDL